MPLWIGRKLPVKGKKPLSHLRIVNAHSLQRPVEPVLRHRPEIGVVAGDGAKPCILQLLGAPVRRQGLPVFGKRLLPGLRSRFARCRCHVKERAVGIEYRHLDRHPILPQTPRTLA